MISPDRRQSPRMTMERLAYIQIEPNNGGIVLNVSSGGLSFESVAPVERNEPLRFSLSEHKRSIDACGELVWTDERRKSGGLRFTMLSSEARGQICGWLNQTGGLEEEKASPSVFSLEKDNTSTPVLPLLTEANKFSSPMAPLEEDKASTPVVPLEESAASPSVFSVEEDKASTPVLPLLTEANKSSSPMAPLEEDKASTPVVPFLVEEESAASPSVLPVEEDKASTPVLPLPLEEDKENKASTRIAPLEEEDKASIGKFSLLGALRPLRTQLSGRTADSGDSSALAVALVRLTGSVKLSRFSAGVATGLLIAALGASIFLFCYAHRREFGESLVRLGEQLGAHREVQTQNAFRTRQAVPPTVVLPTKEAGVSAPPKATKSNIPPQWQQNLPRSTTADQITVEARRLPRAAQVERMERKLPVLLKTGRPAGGPIIQNFAVGGTEHMPSAPPAVFLGAPVSPFPNFIVNEALTVPQPLLASAARARGFEKPTGSTLQMYFDLGKFKDELLAHNVSDRVARLGLRTTVLPKKFLWKTSYQVLVGPYSNEEEQSRVEKDLLSRGYKPRPFERGSRDFLFVSRLNLNGSRLPVGDLFTISWESYVADAKVQFARDGDVIATAHGRWMKGPRKYSQDEYVYVTRGDGSKTLLEIHFSGLNRALVFRNPS